MRGRPLLEVVVKVLRLTVVAVVAGCLSRVGVYPDSLNSLGFLRVAVNRGKDRVHSYVAGGYLKRERHLSSKRLQDVLHLSPEHRIMCPGHADVGDICRALRENPLVGGRDVRMSPKAETYPSVEIVAHCDFLAGGLCVDIDYYDLSFLSELG